MQDVEAECYFVRLHPFYAERSLTLNRFSIEHKMPIIDAHVHLSDIASFHTTAKECSHVDYSLEGLRKEFQQNNVVLGIGMGVTETAPGRFPDSASANPMTLDLLTDNGTDTQYVQPAAQQPVQQTIELSPAPIIVECPGVNPVRLADPKQMDSELSALEAYLERNRTVGIKIYAGYYHYHVHDAVYEPVYELAKQYKLPVVIHTGDTYSQEGLLKYSHPLNVDELAVRHRDVTFMICHLGDPWVMDGAEIVYKNDNVFADLSGLIVGDRTKLDTVLSEPLLMDHFRRALVYGDVYEKMLFGSDWPLAPIDVYIDFVCHLLPERWLEAVFYKNACNVFPKIRSFLE